MKENKVPTLSDFPEFIQKGFINNEIDINKAKEIIVNNLEKGKISQDIFCNSMDIIDSFERGKKATVGEVCEWSGKKFKRTNNGWETVVE